MSRLRIIISSVGMVAALASGFGLWSMISPEDEKNRNELLKQMPESNVVRMDENRKKNALMLQILKEAAETNENIARRVGGQK
ncbi:ubiquinol-cytochrome-c reductase complex assembly factor 3 [Brachyhypopomus gauderio]|uniref:ubiquinol-cytochrome-c reductase complex assembly factor 3 n=1 Tax=Brachyhypopomus gauderio TaxID=698409 RepID=UPI00404107AB